MFFIIGNQGQCCKSTHDNKFTMDFSRAPIYWGKKKTAKKHLKTALQIDPTAIIKYEFS